MSFQYLDFKFFNRLEIMVVDVGVPADWVKVNVQRMVQFSLWSWFVIISIHRDLI